MKCRQCGYELGEADELAQACAGDKPQSWGYNPEDVDWFCASHATDLHMPELADQDAPIWIGKP